MEVETSIQEQQIADHPEESGERAPDPPLGYYPVHPAKCPICGAETAYDPKLSSKRRGAGWRCLKGGTANYWHKMGLMLAYVAKQRQNSPAIRSKAIEPCSLLPPVVLREGQQCFAWDGIQNGDQMLYPGIRRSEVITSP